MTKQRETFETQMRATAASIELEAEIKHFEAACTRGAFAQAEIHRQKARDLLDSMLDLKSEAISAVLAAGRLT